MNRLTYEVLSRIKFAFDVINKDIVLPPVGLVDYTFFNYVNSELSLGVPDFPLKKGDQVPKIFYDKIIEKSNIGINFAKYRDEVEFLNLGDVIL